MRWLFVGLLAWGPQSDPVTGVWVGQYTGHAGVENPIQLELVLEVTRVVGFVVTEAEKVRIDNGSFEPSAGRIHFEVDYPAFKVRYIVDGIVKSGQLKGTWKHANDWGDFELRLVR